MFCDMVDLALTRSGYCVDVVRDSREGVKLIESRAKPWDILVSDFSMPFIQGDEVVDRFRLQYPDAKTVMFSGFMRTTGGITPANADAFLRKPFETSELLSVIEKLLAPRRR
jgi:DNA-binding response OmpR family regulator